MQSSKYSDDYFHWLAFINFRFKLYNLLKVHILHVHVRKFEQICDQCGKVYVSKAALKKHKRSHDEMSGRVQCTYCSVMMRNEFALSNHISRIHKSSPANCPHCPKISPNRSALASHILTRHNFKVHKCHMCDRVCKSAMALKVCMKCIDFIIYFVGKSR